MKIFSADLINTTAETQTQGNNSTKVATTAYVDTGLATKVPYTGASANVNLGVYSIAAGSVSSSGGIISTGGNITGLGVYALRSTAGDAVVSAQNFDTTATSDAIIEAYAGFGGAGGDALIALTTSLGSYSIGADVSDSNKLKFSTSYKDVATNTFLSVDTSGSISTLNTTEATSPVTGSLKVSGGIGISKNIWLGENHTTTITSGGSLFQIGSCGITLPLAATTVATSLIAPTTFTAPSALVVSNPTTLSIIGAPIAGTNVTFAGAARAISVGSGQCFFGDTTVSTSSSTGGIVTTGGVGISNTTDAVDSTNGGGLTVAGGVAINKKLFVGGLITADAGLNIGGTSQTINLNSAKI